MLTKKRISPLRDPVSATSKLNDIRVKMIKGAHWDSTLSRLAVRMTLYPHDVPLYFFVCSGFSEMLKLNDSGETFIALMIMQFVYSCP